MTTDSWKKHKSIGILSVRGACSIAHTEGLMTQPTGTPTATPTATTVPTTTFPINEVDMAA